MNNNLGSKKIFLLFSLLFILRANAQNCDSLIIIYSTFNDNGELFLNPIEIDSLQNGLIVSRSIGTARTEYSYDSLSRLISVKSLLDSTIYSYDSNSKIATTDYYRKINNVWEYRSDTAHVEYYYSSHGLDSVLKFIWDGSTMNSFFRLDLFYNAGDTLYKMQTEKLDSIGWKIHTITLVTYTNILPGVTRIDSTYHDSIAPSSRSLISYYDSLLRIVMSQSYFSFDYHEQHEEFVYDCNQLSEYHTAWAGTHNSEHTYYQFDSLCRITNMQSNHSGQSWYGQTLADYYYVGCSTQLVLAGFDSKICKGDSVEISAAHFGGKAPYIIQWTPSQGLTSDTSLVTKAYPDSSTTYIISITDSNGLVSTDTLIVNVVNPPVASITISNLDTNSVCQSAVLFNDSAEAYYFNWWQDGLLRGSASQLNITTNGLYVVGVDLGGANFGICPAAYDTLPFNYFGAAPPSLILSRSCNEIYASSSVPSQIKWFYNNQLIVDSIRDTLVVTQNGVYSAIATDSLGCTSMAAQINYTAFVPSLTVKNTCLNNCSGEIQARPFIANYLWSNGATTAKVQNLCAGVYSVVISDQFGCTALLTDSVKVFPEADYHFITTGTSSDSVCDATVIPVDTSNTPYNAYYWWDNATYSSMVTAMCAGWHTVNITPKFSGCQQVDSFFVPSALSTDTCSILESHTNMSCNGYANGTITIGCSTGSPYACYWTTPNLNANLTKQKNLNVGTYSCLMIDRNGCMDSVQVSITEPAPLAVSFTLYQSSCGDSCRVTANASGGTAPYGFQWCDLSTTSYLVNCIEECRLYLTDSKSCLLMDTVIQPAVSPILFYTINNPASCPSCNDGSIIVVASGGVPPYLYTVDNGPPVVNDTISNLSLGLHSVCVTGNDGCSTCEDAQILLSINSEISGNQFSVFPNPVHDRFVLSLSDYSTRGHTSLLIIDALGRVVRELTVDKNQFEFHRGNLASGIYTFVLLSGNIVPGRVKVLVD